MQNGQIGVIIIVIAVILSTAGGFLFNAKETTACTTNFDYVTDIAGAFDGTTGDIEVAHNPMENINGYSVFNPTNQALWNSSTVSGIDYTTTSPNGYWVYKQTGDPITRTLNISHNRATNNFNDGTITYNFGSGTSPTSTISGDWGLDNAEIRTVIFVDGDTHVRVAGTTVSTLIQAYKNWAGSSSLNNISSVRIYFDSSTSGFPGFISNMSFSTYRSTTGGYNGINNEVKYSDIQNDIVVNPLTGSVMMGNSSYSWENVYLVWGDHNSTSSAMTMIIGSVVETQYIDPLNGVRPISMTVSDPTQQGTEVNATHISGSFQVPAQGERVFDAILSYKNDSDESYLSLFRIEIIHFSNGYYSVSNKSPYTTLYDGNMNTDLYVYWDWNINNPNNVRIWINNSTMPEDARSINALSVPYNGTYNVSMSFNVLGDNVNNVVSVITNNSATPIESTSHTGGSSFNFVTQYNLPAEVTYTQTYWSNGGENSNLSMIFKKPTSDIDNTYAIAYALNDGTISTESVRLGYSSNHWFFYNESNTPVDLGNWAGMMLTIDVHNSVHVYTLTPIDTFLNFQEYTTINYTYTYQSSTVAPDPSKEYRSVAYLIFNNTNQQYLWHQIQNTTIFLPAGGLYLYNGIFSPAVSFPDDQIIQFRIMSAAHTGNSVSVMLGTDWPYDTQINIDGTQTYEYEYIMTGYLPGGESVVNDSIPGITIGTLVYGGTPRLIYSGHATTDGVYYVNAVSYTSGGTQDVVLKFVVVGAENPSASLITYQVNTLGTGLIIDGTSYNFSDIGFYYVDADIPSVTIGGQVYAGGLYINGQVLEKGHLYLQAGRNREFKDLGETTNEWAIQLNGLWAFSTAYYTGSNIATTQLEWDDPGSWHWDKTLTLIVFIGAVILALICCSRVWDLGWFDWVISICACVIALMLLG